MLVIGGGIIGLEMATVYSTLGSRIDVVEMLDGLMQGADRDLVKVWEKMNAGRFDKVMLKTKTVGAKATEAGIDVSFEGEQAPAGPPQVYDLVLVSVGRSPNGKKIGAEKAGIAVTERGFIDVDKQMRTNVSHIFAIGTSSTSRCWRTRRCMKPMWPRKSRMARTLFRRAADSVGRLYRPRSRLGRQDRGAVQGRGAQGRQGGLSMGGLRSRHRQRSRRGLYQAAVRHHDAPRYWRRHRRDACRRSHQRDMPCDRDGLRAGRYRQDHFIRIRRLENPSAWQPRCSRVSAQTFRHRRKSDAAVETKETIMVSESVAGLLSFSPLSCFRPGWRRRAR